MQRRGHEAANRAEARLLVAIPDSTRNLWTRASPQVCAETEIGTSGHADMAGVYTDEAILDNYMPEEGQVVVERIGYQVSDDTTHCESMTAFLTW